MSFGVGLSAPSCNPSLAWVMGNSGKGRMRIKFPFTLETGWYSEQSCTGFLTFQHRKERQGFKHEFILLKLTDGSVCRVERMGDPNARFNAITPRGSIAHDMAQTFQDMNEACLETSDIVAEITLPVEFDIMDVLKICRAIHEGEKTRNYTLQVYNCWFFSLAIQVCLARLIAHWEDRALLRNWLSEVSNATQALTIDQMVATTGPPLNSLRIFRVYLMLSPLHTSSDREENLVDDVKSRLLSRVTPRSKRIQLEITRRVNDLLWYSTIGSSLGDFIEEEVQEVVMETLRERFPAVAPIPDTSSGSQQSLEHLKRKTLALLTVLLDSAGAKKGPKPPQYPENKPQILRQKPIDQVTVKTSPQ
ncbi:hypothetical protein FRC11_014604, partial [Ceratobasidium sp. 423]